MNGSIYRSEVCTIGKNAAKWLKFQKPVPFPQLIQISIQISRVCLVRINYVHIKEKVFSLLKSWCAATDFSTMSTAYTVLPS